MNKKHLNVANGQTIVCFLYLGTYPSTQLMSQNKNKRVFGEIIIKIKKNLFESS